MQQPDRLKVRAIIPSAEQPPQFVVNHLGLYPEIEVASFERTTEDLLHEIGRKVMTGAHLSVDNAARRNYQIPYSQTNVNIAHMTTDPVSPHSVTLTPGYRWDHV